jgi:hypothetical protein
MKKTALITGASSGIGAEFAKIFAQNNYNLVLIARSEDVLNKIKKEIETKYGVRVWIVVADLTLADSPQQIFNFTKKENIVIDYLINNAGFGDFGYFHQSNWQKQQEMINLNITSLCNLCYLFGNEMANRKSGKILNVASVASFMPGPLMSIYYATKSFVLSFSEALNNELSDFGVTVTVLCPGPVNTNFVEASNLKQSKLFKIIKPVEAFSVAYYGFKMMMKGKTIAIYGINNRLLIFLLRFVPRNWVVKAVRLIQNRKESN